MGRYIPLSPRPVNEVRLAMYSIAANRDVMGGIVTVDTFMETACDDESWITI